ncbi:MAG: protein-export chaperone SecB [Alphaproteobacteria bacterium]
MTSDTTATPPSQPDAGGTNESPAIMINGQYIRDFSFEAPNAPAIFNELKAPPEVTISVDIEVRKLQATIYESALEFHIEGRTPDKVAFILEMTYCAVATINVPPEHVEPILLIEIPRLLFPFARSVIADITRDSGFPPLLLAPIDFVAMYRQRTERGASTTVN